jgi:probable phosphoglycerate mutase
MLTLYLVRHGQTECARENRFCGSGTDVPLLPVGVEMAEALAAYYGADPWEAIYSSPALRARETAGPLARKRGLPVRVEEGLRGRLRRGRTPGEEVHPRSGPHFGPWAEDPGGSRPREGRAGSRSRPARCP